MQAMGNWYRPFAKTMLRFFNIFFTARVSDPSMFCIINIFLMVRPSVFGRPLEGVVSFGFPLIFLDWDVSILFYCSIFLFGRALVSVELRVRR